MKINKILAYSVVLLTTAAMPVLPGLAATPAPDAKPSAQSDPITRDVTGSYLSGQFARNNGDIDEAIRYLRRVYKQQPDNTGIAVQLQGMLLLRGQIDEAYALAQTIDKSDMKDPLTDLIRTLHAVRNKHFDEANDILTSAVQPGHTQLWVPLIAGWVSIARHTQNKPLVIETMGTEVGRAAPLVNYHLALINNEAGFKDAAALAFKNAIDDPTDPPSRVMAFMLKFYDQNDAPQILTPVVNAYRDSHPEAQDQGPLPGIATASDGIAEIMYSMGGIMFGAGVVNDAAIYLQLATYIKPDFAEAHIALGDAFGELHQYALSSEAYAKVAPESPLYSRAQLHIAVNYERMGKLKEALALLDKMAKNNIAPSDALVTKGDLLRIRGQHAAAVDTYNQALKLIPTYDANDWPIFFARGSCLERLGKWKEAERDLQQALKLKPDQPDVLNYLAYGWLEHNQNVDQARALIERAVRARPNDAQIVDSMGWALYLQGDYRHATDYLEKAVELIPGDPTVNDHLGDVYWRLGRKTEARFQWERALTFTPDAKLTDAIRKKIKEGLPPSTLATKEPVNDDGKKAADATP